MLESGRREDPLKFTLKSCGHGKSFLESFKLYFKELSCVFKLYSIILINSSYNIVFLVLTYGIPIVVMLFCYSLMGRELWGSRSIGERTERQIEAMKSKKKVNFKLSHKTFIAQLPKAAGFSVD